MQGRPCILYAPAAPGDAIVEAEVAGGRFAAARGWTVRPVAADAANDDGALRQMTNEDSVIAAEGGSSLRGGAAPVIAAEGGPVIEDGGRGTPAVFSLDTAGNRTGAVPSRFEDGVLRFEVCTRGPDGGRIYYEIARQP